LKALRNERSVIRRNLPDLTERNLDSLLHEIERHNILTREIIIESTLTWPKKEKRVFMETAFLKPLYRRRTAVERVNNIVTKELGSDYLRYKGLRAVTFQAYITCIYQLAAALCAVILGLKKDMRKVSFFR
jgi:hypothetical protein